MSVDKRMLSLAATVAREALNRQDNRSFRLGAVGMRNDGVIVFSRNIAATDVTPSAHAEARVIKKLTPESFVWVARISRNTEEWALARPCWRCLNQLKTAGVKKVIYTISPNEWGTIQF